MKARRLVAIAHKESLHLLRDWRSLALALAMPLLLILVYGYALTFDLRHAPIVICDQSQSRESRELISLITGTPYFDLVGYVADTNNLSQYLIHGRAMLGLVIARDFAENIAAQRPATVQLLIDGSDANTSRLARGYAETVTALYSRTVMLRTVDASRLPGQADLRPRSWYNPDLRSQNVLVPGIIAMVMVVVAALLTSTTIAKEWESGSMEQLISTPVQADELIFGKVAPYFVIGMLDVALAVVVGRLVFAVPIAGNAALLFALSALFLCGALFLGLLLSSALKSQVLANQLAILTGFLPTLILSGFVFAIANMPQPLQWLTYIVPARYFIVILRGIYLKGIGLEILWVQVVFLAIYALIMLFLTRKKLVLRLE
ncbi:MAG: ABC transporter permease [Desulfobulbaceae bacterium]|jgi:ABC-2 type transport system permease protein|nr:ABC transporter permease [Desulfobulbaceae bacterium]